MITNIIFDLDGTLLNTLEDLTDSVNYALAQAGFEQKSIDQIRDYVGNGVGKLFERALPGGKTNPKFEKCINIFKQHYEQNMYNKTTPYDGIIPVLKKLKSTGCKLAVVSNKFDLAVKELCEKYFGDLIDFAAGENEQAGIRKKPAPDTVLSVMDKFGATKDNTIYVGDSEVDIQTANNANIPCISVCWGFKSHKFLKDNNAQIIISNPQEILDILNKI